MINKLITTFFNKEFIKFCIVGGLGTVTDMGILAILNKIFSPAEGTFLIHTIWLPGYFAAILQNYLVNHFWTFKAHQNDQKVSHKALLVFALTSFVSTIPRSAAYESILWAIPKDVWFQVYLANFMGIVAGTIVNFLGSKFIVFKKS